MDTDMSRSDLSIVLPVPAKRAGVWERLSFAEQFADALRELADEIDSRRVELITVEVRPELTYDQNPFRMVESTLPTGRVTLEVFFGPGPNAKRKDEPDGR